MVPCIIMMVDRWKVPDQIASEDPPKYRVQRKDQNERESRSDHGSYLFCRVAALFPYSFLQHLPTHRYRGVGGWGWVGGGQGGSGTEDKDFFRFFSRAPRLFWRRPDLLRCLLRRAALPPMRALDALDLLLVVG